MSNDASGDEFSKDDAVRGVLRGAGVVYAGLILETGLAFVAQRFAAVHLSLASFGNLLSGTAVLSVSATLAGLGLSAGVTRYLPRLDEPQRRSVAVYVMAISVVTSLAVGGVLYTTADVIAVYVFSDPSLSSSFRVFAVIVPFSVLLDLGVGGIRGQKVSRYRVYVKNIAQPGTRFVLIAIAVVIGAGEIGFIFSYAVPFVVGALLAVTLFWQTLGTKRDPKGAKQVMPELLRFSFPFTVSQLAGFLYQTIDVFLLLYFFGNESVAVYGVVYAFAQFMGLFSTSFGFLSTPISSQLESSDRIDEAISVQQTVARWITIASIAALVPMVVYAGDFIRLIYRPAYAEASSAFIVLVFGFGFKGVLLTHGSIIDALGRSKLAAANTAVAGVTNAAVNIVLIPRYGLLGAAATTTLSFLLLGGLPTAEVKYLTGKTTLSRGLLKLVLLGGVVSLLLVPVMLAVPRTLIWTVGTSAGFAVVYVAAIVVVIGLSEEDVMVIQSAQEEYGLSSELLDRVMRRFS